MPSLVRCMAARLSAWFLNAAGVIISIVGGVMAWMS